MIDENFKNIDGESNIEVRKRMLSFFEDLLKQHSGKIIAVVSHGAAIKYFLQHFCNYDFEANAFVFENQTVCSAKLESPSVLKLVFLNNDLKEVKKIIL